MIDELEVVRALGAHEAAAGDGARDRVWARVTGPAPRRRGRVLRPLLAVAAPVALAVAAVVAVAVLRAGADHDDVRVYRSAEPAPAAPALAAPFPGAHQFLYVKSRQTQMSCTAVASESMRCHMDPTGIRESWVSEREQGEALDPRADRPMELSPSAIYLGNRRFTHDEILAYHPTPPELLEMLQKGRIGKQGNGGASYPFVQLTDALREMPLPGPLAVTVVQTLPLVPGVKDEGSVTDEEGRPGHAYSRVVGHMREQVIVDPEQGTMLQERQFALDAEAAPGIEGPDLGNAVYLQRAVVDRVGQRP